MNVSMSISCMFLGSIKICFRVCFHVEHLRWESEAREKEGIIVVLLVVVVVCRIFPFPYSIWHYMCHCFHTSVATSMCIYSAAAVITFLAAYFPAKHLVADWPRNLLHVFIAFNVSKIAVLYSLHIVTCVRYKCVTILILYRAFCVWFITPLIKWSNWSAKINYF